LSQIWGFPNGEEIVGSIVAVNAFLGVVLGVSTSAYRKSENRFDGTIDVTETETEKLFTLNMNGDPYDLGTKGEVLFRVNNISDSQ